MIICVCFYFLVFFFRRVVFGMSFGSIISFTYSGFPFLSKRIISSSTFGVFIFFHSFFWFIFVFSGCGLFLFCLDIDFC